MINQSQKVFTRNLPKDSSLAKMCEDIDKSVGGMEVNVLHTTSLNIKKLEDGTFEIHDILVRKVP